jgi:hypothetical protein
MTINSSAFFLDSAGLFLMMMMRRFLSVVVVSLLLLYGPLFSLSCHTVHLHNGLVLDVSWGGEGGASSVVLSTASSSGFSPNYTLLNLFLNTFTAIFLDSAHMFLVAARAAVSSVMLSTAGSSSALSSIQASLHFHFIVHK